MDRIKTSGFHRRIPHLVAEREGFFAREGLDVDFHTIGYSPDHSRDMARGVFDLSLSSIDKMISLNTLEGADYLCVLQAEEGLGATLVGRKGLKNLEDLRGAVIASDNGTNLDSIRAKILKDAGIGDAAYATESIGNSPRRLAAFQEGRIDAAILTSPWREQAIAAGAVALAEAADSVPQWPLVCGWGRRAWIEGHRALVVRFIRALAGAADWALRPENREAALALLMEVQKVERTRAEEAYALIVPRVRVNPGAVQTVIDLRAEMGAYPPPRKLAEAFFDLGYWKEATA
ncbi:MAG: ABC transporter substrate-binding protein [Alphaproteobacteria bacterium]|nr:ABC transporter substrate-binding protein [Alphaproteobacteria bacterium]